MKWTKEKCRETALLCNKKSEFRQKYSRAYQLSVKMGWINEFFYPIIWTKDKCQEVALLCNTRTEFRQKYTKACELAFKNNWIDEFCSHMIIKHKPNGYWTKEKCQEVALKCKTKTEFNKKYSTASELSFKKGWLNEFCLHMKIKYKPYGYWTKEKCQEEALKYKTKSEFVKNSGSAYNVVYKNNWMRELCSHIKSNKKSSGYWTKERCQEESLKCKTKTEFNKKYQGAYNSARKNCWFDEMCSHMIQKNNNNYKNCLNDD